MTGNSLVQSRFRGIYIGLLVMWIGASLGISFVFNSWIYPSVISMRAHDVESLIRSHQMGLQYNDNRAVRDELLRRSVIAHDQDFDEFRPVNAEDQAQVDRIARDCKFITAQTCTGPKKTLVYSQDPHESSSKVSFVISLTTQRFAWISDLWLYIVLCSLGIGLILVLVGIAIRYEERFLLARLRLVIGSLSRAERVFAPGSENVTDAQGVVTPLDEFKLISDGIAQTEILLEARTVQMEEYKRKFEAKARLEQMAQTITYTSHELKAPLLESIQFYRDLPDFMENLPREKLISAARSLEIRARQGVRSLEQALASTREMQISTERVDLRALLSSFHRRIQGSPILQGARLETPVDAEVPAILIECYPAELEGAIWNLVRNSIEAKPSCIIEICAAIDGNQAVLRYSDDGPGIPEERLERIFEELFTTKPQGSGLGLAIVRKTIERTHGQIRALPSTRGALFEMRFPLAEGKTRDGALARQPRVTEGVAHA